MKNAISSASNYAKSRDKRLYFMLGDMLELGNESGEMHIEIGELCRKSGAVGLYLYGKYKKYTKHGFGGGEFITDSDECINNIADEIKGGVLLVKASRRLNFEIIIDKLKEKLNE
jgi:UDP-N-acetylmuramoyl-tripeptide--D-alanyl-D-alanine ligase